ncbi:MAG: excisionase [Phyllobacteriaceae bacterium]|nr:excisionase [Phyllobacteriaceae bacterium]MBA93422.1 excisionase [Phyllobacteriaceae bacterium]
MNASYKPAAFAVRQFCRWANISRSTFYKEVKAGRIKPVKLGGKTLILVKEAERWLASLPGFHGE